MTFPNFYLGTRKKFFETGDPPGHRITGGSSDLPPWGNFAPPKRFCPKLSQIWIYWCNIAGINKVWPKNVIYTIMTSLWLLKTAKKVILGMWPLIFNDFELESSIFNVLEPLEVTDTFFCKKNWKFCRNVKKLKNMLTLAIFMTSCHHQNVPKY